jgi:hypothetical protein
MSALTDRIARLPYVTRLDATQECDGYRYSAMSFKARRDPVLRATYRCKAPARWRFRALRARRPDLPPASDGTYCWHHLFSLGLYHDMAEEERYLRAMSASRPTEGNT